MNLTLDTIRDIKLYQNKKGYRFSVDALLLYSFVNMHRAYRIADLGAGSGIVGILLAKKYHDSEVALIEMQNSLAGLAEKISSLTKLKKGKGNQNRHREIQNSEIFTLKIKPLSTHRSNSQLF